MEQLHDLANGKFDRIIGTPKQRPAIDGFYSDRNYAPLWITSGNPNARAKAAIAYLGRVWADGLDPGDYPVPNFASLTDPAALAEAEIKLTASVITYVHHAQIGRVHWSRVSGDIFYERSAPDPREVLNTIMEATDVGAALDAYEPHADGYLALKAKLAEFRAGHFGADNTRIPKLTGRQSDPRLDIIIANVERWRWMGRAWMSRRGTWTWNPTCSCSRPGSARAVPPSRPIPGSSSPATRATPTPTIAARR